MRAGAGSAVATRSTIPTRTIIFLALWLIVMGPSVADLPMGVVAALAAAWSSLPLWPAGRTVSPIGAFRFVVRFLMQSVAAGANVAYLALFKSGDLTPGFTSYRTEMPAGMARRAFCAVMSLQPGKLPVGTNENGELLIHCLNGTETAAEEIAADEEACRGILPRQAQDG
jgi:multicomponent Na+:H+ antiporter subunit E